MNTIRFLRHFFTIVFICLLVFIFFIALALKDTLDSPSFENTIIYQPVPTPGSELQELEAVAEISLPTSAREIHGMISGFTDVDIWIRFNLPNADLPAFLQKTRCTEPLKTTDPTYYFPETIDPDWWQPHKATDLKVCYGSHDHFTQRILVDQSEPEMLVIYVFSVQYAASYPTPLTPNP